MKRIMILGCGVYQKPLIDYSLEHYEVVLVAPVIPEDYKRAVYKYFCLDLRKQEEILHIANEERIDGVITDQTDIPVRTVAYVAEKLHLPGNSFQTACLFTDKSLMREKLIELGLNCVPFKKTNSASDAVKAAEEIGYPVIMKPVDNQGSRGVFKIESKSEIYEKYNDSISVSPAGTVLIEKYITGREAVVEGLVMDGHYRTLICGDTHYFDIKDSFAAKTRIFPSKLNSSLQAKILEYNKNIIEGFGLKQGITHSEFVIDSNDNVYLIETAARGGGVFISSDLISIRTGLNTERFLTDIAIDGSSEFEIKDTKKVCCYIAFFLPLGEVVSIDGVEQVKNLPYVHRNILDDIFVGMKTKKAEDKTSRFTLIVSADSYKELDQNIENIKELLDIEVLTDEGIKKPIWE